MAFKALNALAGSHVPNENHFVTATGYKCVTGFAWSEIYRHHVTRMSVKILQQLTTLDVPQGACTITAACEDLLIAIWKCTTGHVRRVRTDSFFSHCHVVLKTQRIYRYFVVQTTKN